MSYQKPLPENLPLDKTTATEKAAFESDEKRIDQLIAEDDYPDFLPAKATAQGIKESRNQGIKESRNASIKLRKAIKPIIEQMLGKGPTK